MALNSGINGAGGPTAGGGKRKKPNHDRTSHKIIIFFNTVHHAPANIQAHPVSSGHNSQSAFSATNT